MRYVYGCQRAAHRACSRDAGARSYRGLLSMTQNRFPSGSSRTTKSGSSGYESQSTRRAPSATRRSTSADWSSAYRSRWIRGWSWTGVSLSMRDSSVPGPDDGTRVTRLVAGLPGDIADGVVPELGGGGDVVDAEDNGSYSQHPASLDPIRLAR